MSLRPRPARIETDEARVEALIDQGGSAVAPERQPEKVLSVQLRLEQRLLDKIDRLRRQYPVAPSRHTWMLEALLARIAADTPARPSRRPVKKRR